MATWLKKAITKEERDDDQKQIRHSCALLDIEVQMQWDGLYAISLNEEVANLFLRKYCLTSLSY